MEMDLTMAGPPASDDEMDINLQKPIEDNWQEHAVVVSSDLYDSARGLRFRTGLSGPSETTRLRAHPVI
jgi:hypothetical protein